MKTATTFLTFGLIAALNLAAGLTGVALVVVVVGVVAVAASAVVDVLKS